MTLLLKSKRIRSGWDYNVPPPSAWTFVPRFSAFYRLYPLTITSEYTAKIMFQGHPVIARRSERGETEVQKWLFYKFTQPNKNTTGSTVRPSVS
jgi:hypothetical protein